MVTTIAHDLRHGKNRVQEIETVNTNADVFKGYICTGNARLQFTSYI